MQEDSNNGVDDFVAELVTEESFIDTRSMLEIKRALEAIILVSSDPAPDILLAQLVEVPVETVRQYCRDLADNYNKSQRGFQLVEVAGGWRYQTCSDLSEYMERYALEGHSTKLSAAALETLSIVAYKQPLSRAQISAIRGVNVDGVLRTLLQKGYVEERGQSEGPGQAVLFGTTQFFLEQLGIVALDDLPSLGEFVPSAEVLEILEETLKIVPAQPVEEPESSESSEDIVIDLRENSTSEIVVDEDLNVSESDEDFVIDLNG